MLFRIVGDRALAGLRLKIARKTLVLFLGQIKPGLAVVARAKFRQSAFFSHASGRVDAVGRIVDRQHPADRFNGSIFTYAGIRHYAQGRHRRLGNAQEGFAIVHAPGGGHFDAHGRGVEDDLRHARHLRGELHAGKRTVQDRHMEGIDDILVVLQPVAWRDRRSA